MKSTLVLAALAMGFFFGLQNQSKPQAGEKMSPRGWRKSFASLRPILRAARTIGSLKFPACAWPA